MIKKAAAAIQSSGTLSLLQRKISNALLQNAYSELPTHLDHQIGLQALCDCIGYNSNDIATLKVALQALQSVTVLQGEAADKKMGGHLSYVDIASGVCCYAYPEPVAAALYDPAEFAVLDLDIQQKFTSGHALALYENLLLFRQQKSTGWWSVDTVRQIFGVENSAYYAAFKHLNSKVLKPAVAEINVISDISVSVDVHRHQRAVSHVRFRLKDKPKLGGLQIDPGRRTQVYNRLMAQGLSDGQARRWIREFGVAQVPESLIQLSRSSDADVLAQKRDTA